MSDQENSILSVITDVVVGVPEPVKVSLLKALTDLIGSAVAIPAAKFKQYAQAIDDATTARSMASSVIAQAVADNASKDPELLRLAAEIYLPTTLRKAQNRVGVAQSAVEHLGADPRSTSSEDAAAPEQDWMNSFMRFAEDASSERMQNLFGRILAGQILRPGAFGLATLRTLSELDQDVANDFVQMWARSVGGSVDYTNDLRRGDEYMRWKRLNEAGLMAPSTSSRTPPSNPHNNLSLWGPMQLEDVAVVVKFKDIGSLSWEHIDFTRIGMELGQILEKPDYENNIRKAAQRLPRHGAVRIDLWFKDKASELIWELPLES